MNPNVEQAITPPDQLFTNAEREVMAARTFHCKHSQVRIVPLTPVRIGTYDYYEAIRVAVYNGGWSV